MGDMGSRPKNRNVAFARLVSYFSFSHQVSDITPQCGSIYFVRVGALILTRDLGRRPLMFEMGRGRGWGELRSHHWKPEAGAARESIK